MPIELPLVWVVGLNVAGWPVLQIALAWLFTRFPPCWFQPGCGFGWEGGGRFYEQRLAIKRWKDHLPDAARWFAGGFAKGSLAKTDTEYLRRFIQETWRGELCHWCAMACAPVFCLWNPLWADVVMIVYALVANLPCILAQRYNRQRLQRLVRRLS